MDEPQHKAIQERAYFLWSEAGCPDGHEILHWLQAEAEAELGLNPEVEANDLLPGQGGGKIGMPDLPQISPLAELDAIRPRRGGLCAVSPRRGGTGPEPGCRPRSARQVPDDGADVGSAARAAGAGWCWRGRILTGVGRVGTKCRYSPASWMRSPAFSSSTVSTWTSRPAVIAAGVSTIKSRRSLVRSPIG